VFDKAFFDEHFAAQVRDFRREHDNANLKVEVVAITGERFDTLQLRAIITGTRLLTRKEQLVFLPYPNIAFIDVSPLQDHRIPGFQIMSPE